MSGLCQKVKSFEIVRCVGIADMGLVGGKNVLCEGNGKWFTYLYQCQHFPLTLLKNSLISLKFLIFYLVSNVMTNLFGK